MKSFEKSPVKYFKVHIKYIGKNKRQRKMQSQLHHIGYTNTINSMEVQEFARLASEFLKENNKELNSNIFLSYTECSHDGIFETVYFGSNSNCIIDITEKLNQKIGE